MFKHTLMAGALALGALSSHAATLLNEGFENVAGLGAAGWVKTNLSAPVGPFGWEQGFGLFDAQAGSATSYAVVNFESADPDDGGVVDNWLITPALAFGASNTMTFWTRTYVNPSQFPDRLEVKLSTAGASSATTAFTTSLLTINAGLTAEGFPDAWTQYTVNFTAAPGASGRLAFRYALPDNVDYSNIIGLDSVTVTAVPEPESYALMLLGMGVIGATLRRRSR